MGRFDGFNITKFLNPFRRG